MDKLNKPLKFVIVSFRQGSGGTIVLHNLCKYLNELGHKAKIFYIGPYEFKEKNKKKFWIDYLHFLKGDTLFAIKSKMFKKKYFKDKNYQPYINPPVKKTKRKFFPKIGKDTIVVYPEVVYGNFLNAKKVVRWLLYFNRYDKDAFGKDDLFVCFRKVFNDKELNPDENVLFTPYFDLGTYKRTNFGNRSGKCFVLRKGASRSDLPKTFDGIIVDDLTESEKVEVFNKCEYCISYDTQTAYSKLSAICGCISVVVPEQGKSRQDYLGKEDAGYGVAYGFSDEEINFAKSTMDKAREVYEEVNKAAKDNVLKFVELCKEYFK